MSKPSQTVSLFWLPFPASGAQVARSEQLGWFPSAQEPAALGRDCVTLQLMHSAVRNVARLDLDFTGSMLECAVFVG